MEGHARAILPQQRGHYNFTMRSASHIAVALPTGGTDQADARAFLQDRIGLWAFWVFVLSFGFYLTNIVTFPFLRARPGRQLADVLFETGNLLHLSASLTFAAVWLVSRRTRLSVRTLRALDVGALVLGCLLFAVMGMKLVAMQRELGINFSVGVYAGLLACANTVMARAIAVPSTARRTLGVSSIAMLPLLPATFAATGSAAASVNVATWCVVSIAIATVGSHVIFGLRVEAARVRRLGQYTLEEKIGAGGMGVVYRASHAMLRRPTAIKLLPPERAGEANLVRFEREVQMTAQLSHPNTVAIYDYGRTPDGVFYYAMEYLDGINLEDLVRMHGPVSAGRVVAVLEQVCGALAEAHDRGLVHRDIKPANIILTERGGEPDVAKVVDFGLVKPLAPNSLQVTMMGSSVLTGTPLYMSPEAMTSPDAGDPRSDLYAVGAVGYFLLTGHPVFEGGSVAEIIGHHLHTEPVPPSKRSSMPIPADLDAVILKCLRKRAEDRPPDARALREDLRRCRLVQPWTTSDAEAWWRTFRSSGPAIAQRGAATASGGSITVNVDVDERLTQAVTRY
jgi:eukaryotic-like serine/threonine-protein kinase